MALNFVAVLLTLIVGTCISKNVNTPFVLFSKTPEPFSLKTIQSQMNDAAIIEGLDDIRSMKTGIFKDYYQNTQVIALFIKDTLRGDEIVEIKSTKLGQRMQSSSIQVPFTTRDVETSFTEKLAKNAHVLKLNEVSTFMQSNVGRNLMNNGQFPVLVIQVPSSTSDLEAYADDMVKAMDVISTSTGAQVLFGLTGNVNAVVSNAISRRSLLETKKKLVCPTGYLLSNAGNQAQFCFTHYTYATPNIVFGLLLSGFMVFLVIIGVVCLNDIQTPSKWAHQGPPKGKEF